MIRSTPDPVLVVVGKSEATYDWPAYQPVLANEPARYRQHSFFSLFDLPEAPSGLRTFKVAVLPPHNPAASDDLNRHKDSSMNTPRLNYCGDVPARNVPLTATDRLRSVASAFLGHGYIIEQAWQFDARRTREGRSVLGSRVMAVGCISIIIMTYNLSKNPIESLINLDNKIKRCL